MKSQCWCEVRFCNGKWVHQNTKSANKKIDEQYNQKRQRIDTRSPSPQPIDTRSPSPIFDNLSSFSPDPGKLALLAIESTVVDPPAIYDIVVHLPANDGTAVDPPAIDDHYGTERFGSITDITIAEVIAFNDLRFKFSGMSNNVFNQIQDIATKKMEVLLKQIGLTNTNHQFIFNLPVEKIERMLNKKIKLEIETHHEGSFYFFSLAQWLSRKFQEGLFKFGFTPSKPSQDCMVEDWFSGREFGRISSLHHVNSETDIFISLSGDGIAIFENYEVEVLTVTVLNIDPSHRQKKENILWWAIVKKDKSVENQYQILLSKFVMELELVNQEFSKFNPRRKVHLAFLTGNLQCNANVYIGDLKFTEKLTEKMGAKSYKCCRFCQTVGVQGGPSRSNGSRTIYYPNTGYEIVPTSTKNVLETWQTFINGYTTNEVGQQVPVDIPNLQKTSGYRGFPPIFLAKVFLFPVLIILGATSYPRGCY